MLEGLEGLEPVRDTLSDSAREGLTDVQKEYISELNFTDEDWAELMDVQQFINASMIDGRMDELNVPMEDRVVLAYELLSPDMAEYYGYYLAETLESEGTEIERIEAPHDHIQIEQIGEVLSGCEELRFENWRELELPEKEALLNSLEIRIAEIEQRPACPIYLTPLPVGQWGGYQPDTKDIVINSDYASSSDFNTYREVVDTLVHEGRHAYQDYNVHVMEIHPRHSEVIAWAETIGDGKWAYWGDCSSELGQRLYEQQSIEIDARNFASDVLDKLNLYA